MRKSVRGGLLLFFSGLTVAVCASGAQAQDGQTAFGKVKRPFRVKIGGYFFGDGNVRNSSGSRATSVGVGYDFFAISTAAPLIGGIYINDASNRRNRTFGNVTLGTETSVTGIGLQVRTYFLPQANDLNFFGGGGLGFYATHVKTGLARGRTFVEDSKNSTRLGGKVMGGVEWKKRFFGELEYTFPGIVSAGGKSFDLTGMNVSIGSRF